MSVDIIKIYDCSNSNERPAHNDENLGPFENDIIRDLKKYSMDYMFQFVPNISDAQVVITNDVFPKDIISNNNLLKIKRMDGTYWQNSMQYRNNILNESALAADLVIFISKFSEKSCKIPLKNSKVVLNCANTYIFYKNRKYRINNKFSWVAIATNWNREEKRFLAIKAFSKMISKSEFLYIIGKNDCKINSPNVINLGYISDDIERAKILNQMDAGVNFSYKDAAPKGVCQMLACGLPVLYTDSGGVQELVKAYGVGTSVFEFDNSDGNFVPELLETDIYYSYMDFRHNYNKYFNYMNTVSINYRHLLLQYFKSIRLEFMMKNRQTYAGDIF